MMKRTIAILLAVIMVFSAAACGKQAQEETPGPGSLTPELPQPLDGPGSVKPVENETQDPEPEEISLTFTEDEWPVIDGATAFLPFYQEMAARMLGVSNEKAAEYIMCSTTDYAYPYLWKGQVDLIFCLRPSEEQIESAKKENGVIFEEVPFASEGFVFFVNKNNPVDSLTVDQLHDIYAGKITNWKQVGGNDEEIIAYQRTEGSGSQTGLYLHVIGPEDVQEPPTEKRIGTMGGIIDAVAGYSNAEGAIGYSYRYFVTNMHYDEQIKMLKIEGVYPDYDSIADGSYPLISDVCAVFREDEPQGSAVRRIASWCCSSQGAWLAKKLGYVPTAEAAAGLVGTGSDPVTAPIVDYAKGNACPACTVMHTYYENNIDTQEITVEDGDGCSASFIRISGLKDKSIERQINDLIEDKFYELYETELPPYPGVRTRLAMFDNYAGQYSYRSCYANITGSFNNILSIRFSKYINKSFYDEKSGTYDEVYIEDCRTLNVDLRTGREIFIADLFADNVDGIAYINDRIKEEASRPEAFDEPPGYYYESIADIYFHRAFEGINPNQKYFINSYDGTLNIVLDYENPEIACIFNPIIYSIDMLGINAYESRFAASESLFTDEVPSPCLFEVPFKEFQNVESYTYIEDWIPEYHVDLSIDLSLYDDMPHAAKAEMSKGPDNRLKNLEEYIRERCAYLGTQYDDTLNSSASYYAYANRYGSFTNTTVIQGFWAADSSWNYVDDMSQTTHSCFAPDSYAPIGLNDLFTPDCDMYGIIENAVTGRLNDYLGDWYGTDTYTAMCREVMTNLDGFSINQNCIMLDCASVYDIISMYLPDYAEDYEVYARLTELYYKDLGMSNLTIFN